MDDDDVDENDSDEDDDDDECRGQVKLSNFAKKSLKFKFTLPWILCKQILKNEYKQT